ncbi:MAG: thioredoxin domain-containing protein [Francisellaceae bacterium]
MLRNKKILISAIALGTISAALAGCSNSDNSKQNTEATPSTHKESSVKPESAAPAKTQVTASETQTKASTAKDDNYLPDASYTLGYATGQNITMQLKQQGGQLNNSQLMTGFEAGIHGQNGKFSEAQMQQIMMTYQKNMMAEKNKQETAGVLANQKMLLDDAKTPTVGPKDAKVAVIEFFDYQCVFCHKMAPAIEKIMENNPNVKYIFKEFPIFGQRWEASQYAAEMGIAAYMLDGSETYLKYHNAVFASGKDEGKLTKADVNKAATQAGIDVTKAQALITSKKVKEDIASDMALGMSKLNIMGTPYVIVMPTSGADAGNITVIPGYAQEKDVQAAIDKASQIAAKA